MSGEGIGFLNLEESLEALGIPPGASLPPVADLGALTYGGNGLKLLRVKAAEDGLEFHGLAKADVGLGNVDNTTDASKNVATAATLATSRDFSITGGGITAAAVGFNGSAAVTLNASVDAGHITLARMANLAANSFIGNNIGSGATPIALTIAQAKTLLAIGASDISGLGTAAVKNTGTSGDAVPVLNGAATTWAAAITVDTTGHEKLALRGSDFPNIGFYDSGGTQVGYVLGYSGGLDFHAITGDAHVIVNSVTIGTFASIGLDVAGSVRPKSYTVGTAPSPSTHGAGAMIYISNEVGGAVIAFSDATNWRRVTDRAVIS